MLSKCHGHERQRMRNYSELKEIKAIGQLNAVSDSQVDSGPGKIFFFCCKETR